MSIDALALVLLSALIHPLRDLLIKGHPRPESAYLAITGSWVFVAGLHAFLIGSGIGLPDNVRGLAIISAACLTAYYYGTMASLKTGDLSIYYPIIRSSPLLIVGLSWAVGGAVYPANVLIGIVVIVVAGFALQWHPGRLVSSPRAALMALVAMAGSAGYTMADAQALGGHAAAAQTTVTPAAFLFWVYLMVTPLYALLAVWFKPAEISTGTLLFGGLGVTPWKLAAASLISYASYSCILTAFSIGAGAAETAAVRQTSIPVSVILAAALLGETRFLHRLGWASLIAVGIVLIAVSR